MASPDVKMTWLLALVFSVLATPGAMAGQPLQVVVSPQGESLLDPKIKAVIYDSDAPVAPGSIRLFLDNIELLPLVITDTPNGAEAEFQITTSLQPGSLKTARVVFSYSSSPPLTQTNIWTFVVGPLTRNTLFIEAEDYNYTDANGPGRYLNFGVPDGSYFGLGATPGVDYYETNNPNAQTVYRGSTGVEIRRLTEDTKRGERQVSEDYVVHSNNADAWFNYTRDFGPSLNYFSVYMRVSSTAGARARLDRVESATTTNQTLTPLGIFNVARTDSSNIFNLTRLEAEPGQLAFVRLCRERTLRLTILEGDLDINYFALVRAGTQLILSRISSVEPRPGSDYARAPLISAFIKDENWKVLRSSLKLYFECMDVTGYSTITDLPNGAAISFQAPELSPAGTPHDVRVEWLDDDDCGSGLPPRSFEWSYTEGIYNAERNLFIEAEDFDTGGGVAIPSFNDVPFNAKGQYNGLGAVLGIDFNDRGSPESDLYRQGEDPNVGMSVVTDAYQNGAGPRPGFETVPDYKVGWNEAGDWYDYTRFWPSGPYRVYLRASQGDLNERINGELSLVHTNGTQTLGSFQAPATGGWDKFVFVLLRDNTGNPTTISLRDVCTLRYTPLPRGPGYTASADFNYLMFVPAPHVDPFGPWIRIRRCDTDDGVQLRFSGLLQSADSIDGPWRDVTDSLDSFLILRTPDKQKFWRAIVP